MALIDDFRKQTRETILDYMDRLGVNHTVYSTHLKGYEPDLEDKNVFIYIHAKSMVVVCFDLCGNREEIADEQDPYDLNIVLLLQQITDESCLAIVRGDEGDGSSCHKHIPARGYSRHTVIRK